MSLGTKVAPPSGGKRWRCFVVVFAVSGLLFYATPQKQHMNLE